MAKIHTLEIRNFRGIKEFSHVFGGKEFICLIGRGDSGKSTILEAISYVLSPSWNITFYDSDFYNCDTSTSIEIIVSLTDLPEKLIREDKFGLYIRGLNKLTNEIHDEIEDEHEKILTIKLEVKRDLEPKWNVINSRQEPISISGYDRGKFNVFIVSDYLDRHFSWSKGNPLSSLLKQENTEDVEDVSVIIDALREAKTKIDTNAFSQFDGVLTKVKTSASQLGIDISKVTTTIDFKDISVKDGRVCLHEDQIPFRLKGKGSKRLISIAIQIALADKNGIVLIDEIEQGLEPDRSQHLVNTLKTNNFGQIFVTTHSRDILVELETADLFLTKKNASSVSTFNSKLQGCLRKNPESFFARKIIVCEGATEIGICRALNTFRVKQNKNNAAVNGVRFADGTGSEMIAYCEGFKKTSFPVCLFCDSDNQEINNKKEELKAAGIVVIDWNDTDCLEVAILKDLPFEAISKVLSLAKDITLEQDSGKQINEVKTAIWDAVKKKYVGASPDSFPSNDSADLRLAIGKAAKAGGWYKGISKGEKLGNLIFLHYDNLDVNGKLKKQLDALSNWIDNG